MKKIEGYLYEKEMQVIRDACNEIWKRFGGAFKESIVDKSLTIALQNKGLKVEDQKRVDVYFDENKVGTYVLDKVINNIILVEVKCKSCIILEDTRQLWHYLKATSYKVGLIINFSPTKLEIVRRVYDISRPNTPLLRH